jgi:hypothetical protein
MRIGRLAAERATVGSGMPRCGSAMDGTRAGDSPHRLRQYGRLTFPGPSRKGHVLGWLAVLRSGIVPHAGQLP